MVGYSVTRRAVVSQSWISRRCGNKVIVVLSAKRRNRKREHAKEFKPDSRLLPEKSFIIGEVSGQIRARKSRYDAEVEEL